MTSKSAVMFGMVGGMTAGGAVPMLFGDYSIFDLWGVIGAFVGGIVGIWLAVVLSRRFG